MKITSRSVLSFALLAAALLSATFAFAISRPTGCPEGYVYLETGDANSGTIGTGFDHSSFTVQSTTGHWSDHLPPSADKDYYVASLQLATPNNNNVAAGTVYRFGGRKLMLDAGGVFAHCSKNTSICDFGENVIIKGGAYSFPALGTHSSICSRAKATVSGTSFKFEAGSGMNSRADACYLDWSMTGAADAQFSFTQQKDYYTTWWLCGDCSKYYGRCVVKSSDAVTTANYSILAISNTVFNGTIEIQKYERLQSFGDDAFIARAEIAEDATLDIASGHTTRIGTLILNGRANFTTRTSKLGLTEGLTFGPNSQVLLARDIDGAIITMPSAVAFDVETFLSAVQRGDGAARTIAAKVVDNVDGTKSLVVLNPGAVANGTLTIDEDLSITGGDAKYRVSVAAGRTLDLINGAERMAVELKDNATLNIRRRFEDWSTIPTLWLDASAADTVTSLSIDYEDSYACYDAEGTFLKQGETVCYTNGYPFVKGWKDCRSTQTAVKLWNNRYDKKHPDNEPNFHKSMHGTFPYLVTNGLNGKNYLSFGKKGVNYNNVLYTYADGTTKNCNFSNMSRIFTTKFASDATVASDCAIKPKYVIMVFGSQMGGGVGLLGDNSATSKFVRTDGVDNPILPSDTTITAWVDGRTISNPGTATHVLNGGWQVITLGVNGNSVNGFGYSTTSGSDNGGQNYAEIIFVEQELTERQRQTIEIYLAEKWGLADKYHYPDWAKDPFATVYGSGTVKLDANATLGGAFKGTVDLNGNDLVIDGTSLPPTEGAVNTDSCIGWFDPDDEKTLVTQQVNGKVPSTRLNWINDKIRGAATGALALHSRQNTRAAGIDRSAHDMGPVRTWLDYANLEGSTDYTGCLSGLRAHTGERTFGGDLSGGTNVNTMIMVIDSRRGGGNPFFDGSNVNTADGVIRKRDKKRASDPIYPSGTGTILTEGKTYLDGIEVDGTTQGFSARAEVLSVVPHGNYPLLSFAMLGNSEKEELCGDDKSYAEIEGEILLWTRALPDAERKVVEAYLSYKWLGLANAGYSDLTAATVTGAGKVTAASAVLLPKFAAGFTGTVAVPLADGLAFTLVTDATATTVVDALDLGGGALEIPAGTTSIGISVAKSGAKPKAGSYKLIGWTAKPAVTWNLSLVGWERNCTALRTANDGLYLDLEKVGMTVLIR